MNLECPVRDWARTAPASPALAFQKRRWTYQNLHDEVSHWTALLLSKGVLPESRIALLSGNSPGFVFVAHAAARLGATLAPLNVRLTRAEVEPIVRRLSPALAIAEERLIDRASNAIALEELAQEADRLASVDLASVEDNAIRSLDPNAVFAILFTSGTSGPPKGAELTLGNFVASARASAENLGGETNQRWLACLPLYHVGGLAMLTRTAWYGAELVVHPRFDADAVNAALEADAITHVSLVENALTQTLDARASRPVPATLKAALIGGGPVSAEVLNRARRASMPALHTYGLTEATSQVTTERRGAADGRTSGLPLAGIGVQIVDSSGQPVLPGEVGEIEVRGPTVMLGYWSDAASSARAFRDGWLRTQDLGALDALGRLVVLGRRSDLMVSGGENVYPAEVEQVLSAHPRIAEVAVVAREDPRWGQVPIAAFVSRAGGVALVELDRWCRARLAGFKVPKQFLAFESLPRNAIGKVDRAAIQEMIGHAPDRETRQARSAP